MSTVTAPTLASPPTIDVEALLEPIPGDCPSGESLAYGLEYHAIREARRREDDLPQGDWQTETKSAEWSRVVEIGSDCLARRTKDLQIASWMTEALTHLSAFAGLRDGLRLMGGIQQRYWETYYPRIDDGDLESRIGPFFVLNDPKTLPMVVRGIPLTDGEERYDYRRYEQSRAFDNEVRKSPDKEAKLRAEGRISGKQFDDEVARTPRRFYERLVADLLGARAAFDAFAEDTDERFGDEAPSLLNLRDALTDCLELLGPILKHKRQVEPIPELDALLAPPVGPQDEPSPDIVDVDPVLNNVDADGPVAPPSVVATPQDSDQGRILIEFLPRARALAELGQRLQENRKQHAELLDQIRALDRDYQELANQFSKSREAYQILGNLLKIPAWTPPPGEVP